MIYQWFQQLEFAFPEAFALLLLLPVMIWWYRSRLTESASAVRISSNTIYKNTRSWRTGLSYLPFLLRMIAVILLITAIANPGKKNEEQLVSGEGMDIMLCMDVSGSMLAQDFQPNRLEAMKQVAATFVDQRKTDRIGLVIFAGESFTACPLTSDKSVLKAQIFNANGNYLADGTAIGDGLATSVERLRGSSAKSKIIIFLTDGEDQGGRLDPLAAKELARNFDIRVYTIGMGTEGFAPAPQQLESGEIVMQQQKVNLNEALLRDIAAETGGLYFRARDNNSLQKIYSEIDKLEKSTIEISVLTRYEERFLWLAISAAAILVLEILLKSTLLKKFP